MQYISRTQQPNLHIQLSVSDPKYVDGNHSTLETHQSRVQIEHVFYCSITISTISTILYFHPVIGEENYLFMEDTQRHCQALQCFVAHWKYTRFTLGDLNIFCQFLPTLINASSLKYKHSVNSFYCSDGASVFRLTLP